MTSRAIASRVEKSETPIDPRLSRRGTSSVASDRVKSQSATPLLPPPSTSATPDAAGSTSPYTRPSTSASSSSRSGSQLGLVEKARAASRAASSNPYARPPEIQFDRLDLARDRTLPCEVCKEFRSYKEYTDQQLQEAKRNQARAQRAGRQLTHRDLPRCIKCLPQQRLQLSCSRCQQVKPSTEFSNANREGKFDTMCRPCQDGLRHRSDFERRAEYGSFPRSRVSTRARMLTACFRSLENDVWAAADGGASSSDEEDGLDAASMAAMSTAASDVNAGYKAAAHPPGRSGSVTVIVDESDDE